MSPKRVPQRTCVACRQARGKAELLWIVRTPLGEVKVDSTGKMAGRGAYVCRDEACLAHAIKQKKLGRALGVSIDPGIGEEIRNFLSDA